MRNASARHERRRPGQPCGRQINPDAHSYPPGSFSDLAEAGKGGSLILKDLKDPVEVILT